MVSLFEADHDTNNSVSVGRELPPPPPPKKKHPPKNKKPTTVCFVAVQPKAEREKSYSTADSSSWKRNGLVPCSQQISGQQSYFGTFPFEGRGGGWGGAGSESFRIQCFACWTTPPEAILFSGSFQLLQDPGYWAIQAGLLTPLTFAQHRLSPLAAFISGAYFLDNGRRWQWICKFYTANFKGIFEARSQNVSGNKQ